jgi:hypothetical protein
VSGMATWSRKSSAPETTKTPTVSGRRWAQSRNASMFSREGGRMRMAISACTLRPSGRPSSSTSLRLSETLCQLRHPATARSAGRRDRRGSALERPRCGSSRSSPSSGSSFSRRDSQLRQVPATRPRRGGQRHGPTDVEHQHREPFRLLTRCVEGKRLRLRQTMLRRPSRVLSLTPGTGFCAHQRALRPPGQNGRRTPP